MDFRVSRLRAGEVVAGLSAIALLVLLLVLHWYGSRTGWQSLAHLRWLILVTIACALALTWFQATRRAPAIPVTLSFIVTVLGLATVLWLAYRVIVSSPAHQHVGAVLGLICACGMLVGGFVSLRQEGIAPRDGPGEIPMVNPGTGVPS
jgi:hypothetical protein